MSGDSVRGVFHIRRAGTRSIGAAPNCNFVRALPPRGLKTAVFGSAAETGGKLVRTIFSEMKSTKLHRRRGDRGIAATAS